MNQEGKLEEHDPRIEAEARLLEELRGQTPEKGRLRSLYGVCRQSGWVRVTSVPSYMSPEEIVELLKRVTTSYCGDPREDGYYLKAHFSNQKLFEHYDWSVNLPTQSSFETHFFSPS